MELNNELFNSLRTHIKQDQSGLAYDYSIWLNTIKEVDEEYAENPHICEPYKRNIDDDKSGKACHTLRDRILSFRVNPWSFATEIITKKILGGTTQRGIEFRALTTFQRNFLRDLLDPKIPLMIVMCNRGGAKTWCAALAVACAEYCFPKYKVTILGGSEQQSLRLYDFYSKFMESDLKYIVKGTVWKKHTEFVHGGWVTALPASQKSVRGPRADMLIIDEACQADSGIINSSLPQALTATDIKIVLMSTPDVISHMFVDYWNKADKMGFKKYHWDAYDCPWIPESNIKIFKEELYDSNQFRIEILGLPGSYTGTVFDYQDIENSTVEELPDNLQLIEFSNGVDWGFAHPTCTTIAGIDEHEVSWILSSKSYVHTKEPYIYKYIADDCKEYTARSYCDASHPFNNSSLQDYTRPYGLSVTKIPFNKYKMMMVSNMNSKLEHKKLKIYKNGQGCDKLLDQMYKYSYMEHSDKPKKVDDDHVDSAMLCLWGHRKTVFNMKKMSENIDRLDIGKIVDKCLYPDSRDFVLGNAGGLFR